MSFTLTGTRYIGTGALPTPVLGYDLVETDHGNFYVANSTATAWVLVGSVNSPNLGMLPLTGGTMTGNVAGATGWAPNDSPNFTTTAKLAGVTIATTNDLTTTQTNILNTISPKITQAVASVTTSITTAANVAMAQGVLNTPALNPSGNPDATFVIPAPTFSDGTYAAISSCRWSLGLYGVTNMGNGWGQLVVTNPGGSNTYTAYCVRDDGYRYPAQMQYLIVGTR